MFFHQQINYYLLLIAQIIEKFSIFVLLISSDGMFLPINKSITIKILLIAHVCTIYMYYEIIMGNLGICC
jgi:hypothetical protein